MPFLPPNKQHHSTECITDSVVYLTTPSMSNNGRWVPCLCLCTVITSSSFVRMHTYIQQHTYVHMCFVVGRCGEIQHCLNIFLMNHCNAVVTELCKICRVVVFAGNSQVERPVWRHSDSGHHSAAWRCNQSTSDSDWQHYAGIHRRKWQVINHTFQNCDQWAAFLLFLVVFRYNSICRDEITVVGTVWCMFYSLMPA